jgi:hypothetical protein
MVGTPRGQERLDDEICATLLDIEAANMLLFIEQTEMEPLCHYHASVPPARYQQRWVYTHCE